MSTSAVAPLTDNENTSGSGGDNKKRNKLGYHRTAVACGHCRRRKIRCVPAPDPSETRCQHCIRLRKECQFLPVDHPGNSTKSNRSESRNNSDVFEADPSDDSPSSAVPGSAISEYADSDLSRRASVVNTRNDSQGIIASPVESFEYSQNVDTHTWPQMPMREHLHGAFSQDPRGGMNNNVNWENNNEMIAAQYGSHSFPNIPIQSTDQYHPDIQQSYQGVLYDNRRHNLARLNFNSTPLNASGQQLPDAISHTMGEGMTAVMSPAEISPYPAMNPHMNLHLSHEQDYLRRQQMYSPQAPQISPGGHWYVVQSSQQGFQPHYLPSQRNSGS